MSLGTGRNLSRRSYSGARRSFRVALHVAAVTTLAAVASVPVAQAVCCICEGSNNNACTVLSFTVCDESCENTCRLFSGHMRACCDAPDCSGGVADGDNCFSGNPAANL